ncbi:Hypothetical predicted protein [Cloeon dipterum]|uniref:Metalloendopeptidase n=1 Tax=Cloeon dipterum TaxID=197152 RepID=A0A8S1DUS5_9INSE|nr:Hypothetical predicted protein [Cloeon dipterum]
MCHQASSTVQYNTECDEAQAWARSKVHMAMAQISALTCVRFEPAQTFNTDFLAITSAEDGCWSYVGKIGGRQALNLGNGCISAPVAVHEIIHALGFGHEQSRPDRDKYISFKDEATALNYDKDTVFFVTGFPYDFASAMHYGANGEMFPRDPAVKSLGAGPNSKNTLLSGIDAAKINTLYGCDCP